MAKIVEATASQIPIIREIAEITWLSSYSSILTQEQIHFMLDTLYDAKALQRCMHDGSQKFLLIKDKQKFHGFASFGARQEEAGVFKLHKIYVLPNSHGKGYGSLLIEEIKRQLLEQGISTLDLNVNRKNPAKNFYQKLGFKIIREEDIPIGQYWMNDYVMRLKLGD